MSVSGGTVRRSKLRYVTASADSASTSGDPLWLKVLTSAGGAAVLTAFVGGFAGNLIAWQIQSNLKERDLRNAFVQALFEQQVKSYDTFLDQQNKTTDAALKSVSVVVDAATSLEASKGFYKNYYQLDKRGKAAIDDQIKDIRKHFSDAAGEWNRSKRSLRVGLEEYHNNGPEVAKAWDAVVAAVEDHALCVSQESSRCGEKKDKIEVQLTALLTAMAASRSEIWKGWKTMDQIRALVESHSEKHP